MPNLRPRFRSHSLYLAVHATSDFERSWSLNTICVVLAVSVSPSLTSPGMPGSLQ